LHYFKAKTYRRIEMKKISLIVVVALISLYSPAYGYLLENVPGGGGAGWVSIEVGQGGSATEILAGTDHWGGLDSVPLLGTSELNAGSRLAF
jgi:hypothetical protein